MLSPPFPESFSLPSSATSWASSVTFVIPTSSVAVKWGYSEAMPG